MTNNDMAAFVTMTEAAVCWYARHEHCVIPNSCFSRLPSLHLASIVEMKHKVGLQSVAFVHHLLWRYRPDRWHQHNCVQ